MGVHGFTTWVNRQSTLCDYIELPVDDSSPIPFIIDGFAFLAHIARLSGPPYIDPLRGGNYANFRQRLGMFIEYYRAVGLEPEVVWDGPYGGSKTETILKRCQEAIRSSNEFMRANEEARGLPHVIAKAARLPLLARGACTYELERLGVKMHYAEGEADSPTAELAQRRNGFAVSQDSDYFIFPALSRGYVPLDKIEYGDDRSPRLEQRHLANGSKPRLRLGIYQPINIARSLGLPLAQLPVFAALSGNDLADYARDFQVHNKGRRPVHIFVKHDRIARTLASVAVDSATREATIELALNELMVQRGPTPPIIAELAASARSYELQPIEEIAPHFPLHSRISDTPDQARCRQLYREEGFSRGSLANFIVQVVQSQVVVPNVTLERPEYKSPTIALGRPLRLLVYAIVDDAIGLSSKTIVEHCRRRDELYAASVPVPSIASLLGTECSPCPSPILLARTEDRLRFLAIALKSPSSIPPQNDPKHYYLPLVLSLRHVHSRARRPWTRSAFVSALATAIILTQANLYQFITTTIELPAAAPLEYLQASVELGQTLYFLQIVVDALLLTETMTPAHLLFDGGVLHRLLGMAGDVEEHLDGLLGEGDTGLMRELLRMVEE